MAKQLTYNGLLGPETVSFGEAGQFTKGVPVTVDDDALAAKLLAKGYFEDVTPAATAKNIKTTTASTDQEG